MKSGYEQNSKIHLIAFLSSPHFILFSFLTIDLKRQFSSLMFSCFIHAPSSKTIVFYVNIKVTQLCTLEPRTLGLKRNLLQKSGLKK